MPITTPATAELKTFRFAPPSGPCKGAVVLLHGHGDYSARYESVLAPFLERGLTCFSTDLAGHGESGGKRGFVPGINSIDEVVRADLARAREACPDGPIGLIGHSAGGLLALRELLHRPDDFQFAWISSPLLRPEANRHPLSLMLLQVVATLLPMFPIDTGVKAEDCRHVEEGKPDDNEGKPETLFHSQISLGWGRDLVKAGREVRSGYRARPPYLPILFTQGLADSICPPEFLHAFLDKISLPHATLLEFAGQRHEPFADTDQDAVLQGVGTWLDQCLPKTPSTTSTSTSTF